MLQLKVLVREHLAVDRLAASTITAGKVTSLDHKVLDNAVEGRTLVSEALLSSGQSPEVLGSLGGRLAIETNDNATKLLITVGNVEVDLVGNLWSVCSL